MNDPETRLIAGEWEQVSDKSLGGGSFGTVFEVRRIHKSGLAAQRGALKIQNQPGEEASEAFAAETALLAKLEGLPTTQLIDSGVSTDGRRWFVMNLIEGAPLKDVRLPLSVPEWFNLSRDMLGLLKKLNSLGIAHRDIWPSNVMRQKNGTWTIIDFGLSRNIFDERLLEVNRLYRAPELNESNGNSQSDLFSTGLVLAKALTGLDVREQWEQKQSLHEITSLDSKWADFLEGFLADDPGDRPTPEQLLAELDGRAGGKYVFTPGQRIRTWFELEHLVDAYIQSNHTNWRVRLEKPGGISCELSFDQDGGRLLVSASSGTFETLDPFARSELMRAGFDVALDMSALVSRSSNVRSMRSTPQLVRALKAIGVRLAGTRLTTSG